MASFFVSEQAALARMVRVVQCTPGTCATFELLGQPRQWIQFGGDRLNARYPRLAHPRGLLDSLGGELDDWLPGVYLTVKPDREPASIAAWITTYAQDMLGGGPKTVLCARLTRYLAEVPAG